jgi:hypothetical protein
LHRRLDWLVHLEHIKAAAGDHDAERADDAIKQAVAASAAGAVVGQDYLLLAR